MLRSFTFQTAVFTAESPRGRLFSHEAFEFEPIQPEDIIRVHQHHCWSAATIQQVCKDGGSVNQRSAELKRLTEDVGRKTRCTGFPTIIISPDGESLTPRSNDRPWPVRDAGLGQHTNDAA